MTDSDIPILRDSEDRDVAVCHEEWQRLHVYSHADSFEARDEAHPILLTLKYR